MSNATEAGARRALTWASALRRRRGPGSPPPRARIDRTLRRAARHWPFLALLTAGLLLRVAAMLGYRSAMWFNDGFQYVQSAIDAEPHIVRPNGYAFLLQALEPFHSLALVVALQHLMGLGTAVLIYALLKRRLRCPRWLATLAAAPVLLDAYQVELEHMVLSDTLFTFLITVLVTAVLWWRTVTPARAAAIGLLLAAAVLTRSIGMALLMVVLVYLVIRRIRWTSLGVALVACALPLAGYATWFHAAHGKFALSNSSGPFLYARVMKFADCHKMDVPVEEMPLCTEVAPRERPSSQFYVWGDESPLFRVPGDMFSNDKSALAGRFAKRAIVAQPGDYLSAVGYDVARVFFWKRTVYPDAFTYNLYQFRATTEPVPQWAEPYVTAYEHGSGDTRVVEPYARFLRFYQAHFYLRGTMVGILLLLAVAGVARRRDWLGPVLLPFGVVAGLLVTPAATAEFDYRYVVPAVPMACLAAALAWRPGRPGTARARPAPREDARPAGPAVRDTESAAGPA
ncbi:hypothetical protein [Actinomadura parmotrematis]|uniref:Phospholipid carrier-dependent glycosyltransferase n=1 Tax=Actinomadura parmotrematis TaxID=2864039 RepID=A0ABS7FMP0_9ACTN|nr:hypothetical protein [Actinomadura parmotrematis]MBW8481648.1 hypothetical protein [Actinomadura parmotrematis]